MVVPPAAPALVLLALAATISRRLPLPSEEIEEAPAAAPGLALVTLFSVECKPYFDWQTLTLYRSWKAARVPGRLVRLLACDAERSATASRFDGLGEGELQTHVHKAQGDGYPPLNRPLGVLSWLAAEDGGRALADGTAVLIVDPDMAFLGEGVRQGLAPLVERVQSGAAVALGMDFGYPTAGMRATKWSVPLHFNMTAVDKLQGMGVPLLMRKDQLALLAPDYLRFTAAIVEDPALHALVHDGNQPAPWIAEMYGYSLASASVGLHYETQRLWPALESPQPPWSGASKLPLLVHYDHTFYLCGRPFGKTLYFNTDILHCTAPSSQDLEGLRPPSDLEVASESCQLCIRGGDVLGQSSSCWNSSLDKHFSLYAWRQVHDSVSSWRKDKCRA